MKSSAVFIAIFLLQAALLNAEPVNPATGKAADVDAYQRAKVYDNLKIQLQKRLSKRADPESNEIDDSFNEIFEKNLNPKLVRHEKNAQSEEQATSVDASATPTSQNGTAICDLIRGFMENSANFMSAVFSDMVNLVAKFCRGDLTKTGTENATTVATTSTESS